MQPASQDQLQRWQKILAVPPPADAYDGKQIAAELRRTKGRHRPWIVACLRAVNAVHAGVHVPFDEPLPVWPPVGQRPAAEGARVADDAWLAYLLYTLGEEKSDDWLKMMLTRLNPTALAFTPDDNPEPWWQNEMLILHALHSFALRSDIPALLSRTLQCADFHLREIQPDHATNEPWSIHAYATHPDGPVTAETLLHAAFIQGGGQLTATAALIARDAASALAAFLKA